MKLNQQELQEAGESGRSAGYHFEDIIKDEINSNTKIGQDIINYILTNESITNNNVTISAIKTPKNTTDMLGGRKVPPKADIFLVIKDLSNNILKERAAQDISRSLKKVERKNE